MDFIEIKEPNCNFLIFSGYNEVGNLLLFRFSVKSLMIGYWNLKKKYALINEALVLSR